MDAELLKRLSQLSTAQIKALRLEEEAHLKRLDEEFIQAQALLEKLILQARANSGIDDLILQRSDHRIKLDAYIIMTSPIHTLPPEILAKIFLLLLRPRGENKPRANSAPLLLCQICSRWRAIALESPKLWDEVHIDLGSDHEYALCLTKTWLGRIKEAPFSVSLYGGKQSCISGSTIFATLLPYLPRCQQMNFRLQGLLLEGSDLVNLPSKSLKALELLTINPLGAIIPDPTTIWRRLSTQFQYAPRLRLVKLHYDTPSNIRNIMLPWSQLVSLDITAPFHAELIDAVRQCVDLEEWKWTTPCTFSGRSPTFTPLVLRRLRTLDLTLNHGSILETMFRECTFPSLDRLTIGLHNLSHNHRMCYSIGWVEDFFDFQARSGSVLLELSLHSLWVGSNMERLIRSMPTLQKVRLHYCELWCPFLLKGLRMSADPEGVLLPNLESLEVIAYKTIPDADVMDMIEHRWRSASSHVARLRHVSVQLDGGDPDSEAAHRLDLCREEGLDVEYRALRHRMLDA